MLSKIKKANGNSPLPGTDKFLHTIKLGAGCLMLFKKKMAYAF
jgi:hypothetical protein